MREQGRTGRLHRADQIDQTYLIQSVRFEKLFRNIVSILDQIIIYARKRDVFRVGKIGERLFTREEGSGSKESITGVGNRKGVRLAAKLFRSPTRLRNNRAPTETFRAKLVNFFSPPFFLKVRNGENISSIAGRSE